MSRWSTAGLCTALVHGGLGLLLGLLPSARLHFVPRTPRVIDITVRAREPPRPAGSLVPPAPPPPRREEPPPLGPAEPPTPSTPPPAVARAATAPSTSRSASGPATPLPAPAGTEPAAPSTSAAGTVPRAVNLFPKATLCEAVGCRQAPGPGGEGGPGSGGGSGSAAGRLAQGRVQGMLAEDADVADARAGRVDPGWREAERVAQRLFAPPPETVTADSGGKLVVKQLLRPVTPEAANSKWSQWASNDPANRVRDLITAAQDAYNKPAVGRTVEIEVDVDADGQIVAARVHSSSGVRRLDDEALRAIQRAVRLHPIRDPRGPVTARYSLRAEVALPLPLPTPVVEPNTGAMSGITFGLTGTFDEVTGKVKLRTPFKKDVSTRVDLISVRPRRTAPAPAAAP